jgi:hypothetical protein
VPARAGDKSQLGDVCVTNLRADFAPPVWIPTRPGSDEPPPLAGRKKANSLGHLGRRGVARVVANPRRKAIGEAFDRRALWSHKRKEQR